MGKLLTNFRSPTNRYPWWRLSWGLVVLVGVVLFAVSSGSVSIPITATANILLSGLTDTAVAPNIPTAWDTILWKFRLPRVFLAAIVGAALAMSGAAYQGLFRNPLADPYLVGVASGAGLGATITILAGAPVFLGVISLVPISAFVGGAIAVSISYMVARTSQGARLTTLILAGTAISAFTTAISSILLLTSDPNLRPVLSWLLGSFISSTWQQCMIVLIYFLPGIFVILVLGRTINVLQLGEEQAAMLGVNVERTKLWLVGAATLVTASAVSFNGLIGFVGLIAPHVVRLIWGGDYRFLLPMAALVGAAFLVVADLVARTIFSPGELPVGIITALCGTPFFLYLLRRRNFMDL